VICLPPEGLYKKSGWGNSRRSSCIVVGWGRDRLGGGYPIPLEAYGVSFSAPLGPGLDPPPAPATSCHSNYWACILTHENAI